MPRKARTYERGDVVGPFTVVLEAGIIRGRRTYAVICKCGNRRSYAGYYLTQLAKRGATKCAKCPREIDE